MDSFDIGRVSDLMFTFLEEKLSLITRDCAERIAFFSGAAELVATKQRLETPDTLSIVPLSNYFFAGTELQPQNYLEKPNDIVDSDLLRLAAQVESDIPITPFTLSVSTFKPAEHNLVEAFGKKQVGQSDARVKAILASANLSLQSLSELIVSLGSFGSRTASQMG
jgi:hypothetical protein